MKLEFAKADVVPTVQEVVDNFMKQETAGGSQSDEDFDIERVASDIIILLLTGGKNLRGSESFPPLNLFYTSYEHFSSRHVSL